jgi:hypothetical protein
MKTLDTSADVAAKNRVENRPSVPWPKPVPVRPIASPNFTFTEPGKPCSSWSDGWHIVQDGKCRCGAEYILAEIDHETQARKGAVEALQSGAEMVAKILAGTGQPRQNTEDKLE